MSLTTGSGWVGPRAGEAWGQAKQNRQWFRAETLANHRPGDVADEAMAHSLALAILAVAARAAAGRTPDVPLDLP